MTSSNGNILRVTGPLCGDFTGHRWIPLTKASDAEFWFWLWSAPWINGWVNNREPGGLRHHRAHHNVIVMIMTLVFQLHDRWLAWLNHSFALPFPLYFRPWWIMWFSYVCFKVFSLAIVIMWWHYATTHHNKTRTVCVILYHDHLGQNNKNMQFAPPLEQNYPAINLCLPSRCGLHRKYMPPCDDVTLV